MTAIQTDVQATMRILAWLRGRPDIRRKIARGTWRLRVVPDGFPGHFAFWFRPEHTTSYVHPNGTIEAYV